ncbi:MAG TPA: hypothetical protein VFK80_04860, partial [Limnochordia bacterium]|nr:hypothetical protein [Limnochordia bacterium]
MNEPQSTPTPIPMPEHFPVVWDDPSDAQRFWEQDRMHFPAPIPPVMALFFEAHNAGFKHAFAHYEIPLVGLDLRRYNTYAYNSVIPRRLPPDELEAMGRRAEKNLGAAMGGMAERWSREFLPEIESHLEYWRTYDLQGADLDALLAHFAESRRRYTRLWEIHFEVMVPTLLAGSLFEEIYSELFGAERALDAYTCLQGFGNKTIEINIELWRLAQSADEEVRRVILAEAPQAVAAVLSRSEAGRRFLVAFDAYRVAYGERGETWAFSVPTWMEDPTPIWRNLQEHLRHPEHNPEAEQARLAAARETALAEARAQIAGYPKQVIEQFEY